MIDYIIKQFSKDQGVAQLDVAALNTILRLYSAEGKVRPAAVSYMEDKVSRGLLSDQELEKLAVLRQDYPELASRLGGPVVPTTGTAKAEAWKKNTRGFPPPGGAR